MVADLLAHTVAAQHEQPLAQQVLGWRAAMRRSLNKLPLETLVQQGPMVTASAILQASNAQLAHITYPFLAAFRQAGTSTATRGLPMHPSVLRKASLSFSFDEVNPYTVQAATSLRDNLVRWFSTTQALAISTAVSQGLMDGLAPKTIADQLGDVLGLNNQQAQAVVNKRRALEAQGLPQNRINALMQDYSNQAASARAITVARTEALRAANAGQDASVRQFDMDVFNAGLEVRRFWYYTHDNRTRPDHRAIPGLNPDGVGINEPFKYPGGRSIMLPGDLNADADMTINCRCCVLHRLYKRSS